MNSTDYQAIRQANNIVANELGYKKSIYSQVKHKYQYFIGTVTALEVGHQIGKGINQYVPYITLNKLVWHGKVYKGIFHIPYTQRLVPLHQLKKNDLISFSGRFVSPHIIKNLNHTHYVTIPEDFILRRIVPKDEQTRLGFVLINQYPPMTNTDGQIELNYPPQEKEAIQKYLEWLKRK